VSGRFCVHSPTHWITSVFIRRGWRDHVSWRPQGTDAHYEGDNSARCSVGLRYNCQRIYQTEGFDSSPSPLTTGVAEVASILAISAVWKISLTRVSVVWHTMRVPSARYILGKTLGIRSSRITKKWFNDYINNGSCKGLPASHTECWRTDILSLIKRTSRVDSSRPLPSTYGTVRLFGLVAWWPCC